MSLSFSHFAYIYTLDMQDVQGLHQMAPAEPILSHYKVKGK